MAFLKASNKGCDKCSDVNLLKRREVKLEKKVLKISSLFETLFRNRQVHYLMWEWRKMLPMAECPRAESERGDANRWWSRQAGLGPRS